MNFWQLFREFVAQWRRRRMKVERVQLFPSFDVPMTAERLKVRGEALSESWSLVTAPVAIRYRHRFASFKEAAEFVANDVAVIAEHFGFWPMVQIEGNEVALTLGVDAPQILSEGDFDFASAIDGASKAPEPGGDEPPAEGDEPTTGETPPTSGDSVPPEDDAPADTSRR